MRLILCSLIAVAAFAQSTTNGLEPTWDMATVIDQMGKDIARLLPLLDEVNTAAWMQKGASETYSLQLQSCKEQTRAVVTEAATLARNPEKLSAGLQLFFRLQALDSMLGSLEDGARRYQTPQIASNIAAAFAATGANRERFRSYLVNLAADRERQFEIMDQEAQRCRGVLLTPPPKAKPVKKK